MYTYVHITHQTWAANFRLKKRAGGLGAVPAPWEQPIQVRGRSQGDEELAAVGVGPRVGHREEARPGVPVRGPGLLLLVAHPKLYRRVAN